MRERLTYLRRLSTQQRRSALKFLATYPPQDDDWLWWWFSAFMGTRFPREATCPEHTAPFTVVADAYFARHPVIVLKGSRGLAGKSFVLNAIGTARAVTRDSLVNILGGSGAQSKNVQEYVKGESRRTMGWWWDSPLAPRQVKMKPTATEQRFSGGGKIRALNASQGSVRGPHPDLLLLDEVDEMKWDILNAALGQTMDMPDSVANTVISSTHQNVEGTFDAVLDMAEEEGWPVYEICYRENHEDNGGFLTQAMIDAKRSSMSEEAWTVEVELQEPEPENRVFTFEHMETIFDPSWGAPDDFDDAEGFEYRVIPPTHPGDYVHGADWGRKHYTSIVSFLEQESGPDQLAAFNYHKLGDWPAKIHLYNERLADYGGKGKHDQTGIGDVIEAFIDPSIQSEGFFFQNAMERAEIFNTFVAGAQNGDFTMPYIPRLYRVISRLTNDQVYYGKHPPDEFVACALAFSVSRKARRRRRRRGGERKSGRKTVRMGRAR